MAETYLEALQASLSSLFIAMKGGGFISHTRTPTYTCAHAHACTHTRTHARTHVYIKTFNYTCACAHARRHNNTNMHVFKQQAALTSPAQTPDFYVPLETQNMPQIITQTLCFCCLCAVLYDLQKANKLSTASGLGVGILLLGAAFNTVASGAKAVPLQLQALLAGLGFAIFIVPSSRSRP